MILLTNGSSEKEIELREEDELISKGLSYEDIKQKQDELAKKQKERKANEDLQLILETDPDKAKDLLEDKALKRIKERMDLKHKNTGKWAKMALEHGRRDKSLRESYHEAIQLDNKVDYVTADNRANTNNSIKNVNEKKSLLQQKSQNDLIQLAFAGPDLQEEFEKYKNQSIDDELGFNDQRKQVLSKVKAGWGDWAGPGNIEEYERSLQMPIGEEWNSSRVVKDFTKPSIITRPGRVIEPIKLPKKRELPSLDEKLNTKRSKYDKFDKPTVKKVVKIQ
eukprot:gene18098-23749_t